MAADMGSEGDTKEIHGTEFLEMSKLSKKINYIEM